LISCILRGEEREDDTSSLLLENQILIGIDSTKGSAILHRFEIEVHVELFLAFSLEFRLNPGCVLIKIRLFLEDFSLNYLSFTIDNAVCPSTACAIKIYSP